MASAHRLRGDVMKRQGKWREALAAYHRALSIQPDYPEVQLAVVQVYQRNGKYQRALATIQSLAADYAPGEEPSELFYWQGLSYASLQRHHLAVQSLQQAVARGEDTADLHYLLADAHRNLGDYAAAQNSVTRALQIDPHHAHAVRLCEQLRNTPQVAASRY